MPISAGAELYKRNVPERDVGRRQEGKRDREKQRETERKTKRERERERERDHEYPNDAA